MDTIVCFGEILWDIFPTHQKIGGAPLNVASRLSAFGHNVTLISAIGNDDLGKKLLEYLHENNINTTGIQTAANQKTGNVLVTLNKKGSASYEIKHPSAWDKISVTNELKTLVENAGVFVFGSLIARDAVSRKSLYKLLDLAKYKVFDLNLRPPHYSMEVLELLMKKANFIKFNDEELYEVSKKMGSKYNSIEQHIQYISEVTNTKHICVTKGAYGAVLLYNKKLYYNSGYQIKVEDTVGAGDSFLGSLISQLVLKKNPQNAINFACAVGALVANSEGANPSISLKKIQQFINS